MIEPCISWESTHNTEGTADEKDDDGCCIKNGAKSPTQKRVTVR